MKKYSSLTVATLSLAAVLNLVTACNQNNSEPAANGISLHTELGGSAEGFARACTPREFNFPEDHGPHAGFRNEWWYMTGNLDTDTGKRFGFHITFFRIATSPATTDNISSKWLSNEFYMAHFALTSPDFERIRAYERFSRAAAGLAGATVTNDPPQLNVWLDDWQLNAETVNGKLSWQLSITTEDTRLNLALQADKPIVLQGRNGYSRKSSDPCNASYYYSLPRMSATGTVTLADRQHTTTGSAWLDREWSSSALSDDQVGWDWFALQLRDDRELMIYQLRKQDGTPDAHSYAAEIDKHGNKTIIPTGNITLDINSWWQSDTGARYPVAGTIYRSDTKETINFTPVINNQELDLTVRYWEGAIDLSNDQGQNIGRGYMELTGY